MSIKLLKTEFNIHCFVLWSFTTSGSSAGTTGLLSGFSTRYKENQFMHWSLQKHRRLGSSTILVYGWICDYYLYLPNQAIITWVRLNYTSKGPTISWQAVVLHNDHVIYCHVSTCLNPFVSSAIAEGNQPSTCSKIHFARYCTRRHLFLE